MGNRATSRPEQLSGGLSFWVSPLPPTGLQSVSQLFATNKRRVLQTYSAVHDVHEAATLRHSKAPVRLLPTAAAASTSDVFRNRHPTKLHGEAKVPLRAAVTRLGNLCPGISVPLPRSQHDDFQSETTYISGKPSPRQPRLFAM